MTVVIHSNFRGWLNAPLDCKGNVAYKTYELDTL